MKLLFSASALAVALAAMFAHVAQAPSAPAPSSSDPLIAMLESTTRAWDAGDLDGFIAPYAESSTFMTPAGPIGRAEMRARYQTRYFNNGGRPDQQLRFERMTVRRLGSDHAVMVGRFVLTGGGKPEQSGWFTLVWARTPQGWKILHDHSS